MAQPRDAPESSDEKAEKAENAENSVSRNRREQEDVLEHKDHVIRSDRGLQQWGEGGADVGERNEGLHGDPANEYGDASTGTAERQAHIGGLAPGHKAGEGILADPDDKPGKRQREKREAERE